MFYLTHRHIILSYIAVAFARELSHCLINNAGIYFTDWRKWARKMCMNICLITAPCGPPWGQQRHKSSHVFLVRGQALLIDIFCLLLPYRQSTSPAELHLPALFNIRKDPTSSVRYFKSHESSSVTYQTLNHVLGCRPSPPILLILPKPHSFCLLLRLRLKEA